MAGEASASIKDVAARAGVSPGTVSNVYSGKRPVKQDLVLRVKLRLWSLATSLTVLPRNCDQAKRG